MTGTTGIVLFTIVTIIFVFAHPLVRKKAYNYFWITHQVISRTNITIFKKIHVFFGRIEQ